MYDPTTIELINKLTERVDALEHLDYKFWLPTIISIIASGISFYSINVSKSSQKESILQNINNSANTIKAQMTSIAMEISPLVVQEEKQTITGYEEAELEIKRKALDATIENLLNVFENGCQKFYDKEVNQKNFKKLFHNEIRQYIENFPDKFTPPLTQYSKMVKYFDEHHKNPAG